MCQGWPRAQPGLQGGVPNRRSTTRQALVSIFSLRDSQRPIKMSLLTGLFLALFASVLNKKNAQYGLEPTTIQPAT